MKKIITLVFIVLSTVSFSQNVTVSIENLKVNNVTVPNGSPIDLGTNSSANVTFRVDLAKDAIYSIDPATVYIDVFDSSGNRTEYETSYVPVSEFSTEASANFEIDILSSDINFGNGNYLVATLKQINQPGAEWDSEHIPIIKTPAFELSPNSLSLPCGDTSQRTFTVTNSSNLSGVTYQWNIGNGWLGNVGNDHSITLSPIDGILLPSDVSVTPIYNGDPMPTITCSVNRASFIPSATITGNSSLCSTTNYWVNNLPNGTSVTSWSVSNSNIATIMGIGNQAVLTAVGNGDITIYATLTNSCGQSADISKTNIHVGDPTVTSPYHINGGHDNVSINSTSTFNVNPAIGAMHYYWFITTINTSCGGLSTQDPPRFYTNGTYSATLTSPYSYATVDWGECPGLYVINCRAVNSCGTSDYTYRIVEVYGQGDSPCDLGPIDPYPNGDGMKIYPNPIKNGSVTVNKLPPAPPCDDEGVTLQKNKYIINTVKIFDLQGNVVYKNQFETNEFIIKGLDLKQGQYILIVTPSNGRSLNKIITVE